MDASEKGQPYYVQHHGFEFGADIDIPDRYVGVPVEVKCGVTETDIDEDRSTDRIGTKVWFDSHGSRGSIDTISRVLGDSGSGDRFAKRQMSTAFGPFGLHWQIQGGDISVACQLFVLSS